MSRPAWAAIGRVPPSELREARLQLHWAAQILAAVGNALVSHETDDRHASLEAVFVGERGVLAGMPTETPEPIRAALDLEALEVVLLDGKAPIHSVKLDGRGLDEAVALVAEALGAAAGTAPPSLSLPDYEMPDHPIRTGAGFRGGGTAAFRELSLWFANAAAKLGVLEGPARVWPHHFDIAVLENVDSERSLNTGLSPGDEHYEEPYFYVSPWPYPDGVDPEALASGKGRWHREGFLAAVLTGSEIVASGSAADQEKTVDAFLEEARAAARGLLLPKGGDPP